MFPRITVPSIRRAFSHGHYASVVATLALVVALGGTSYAAIKLPKNSVGPVQIKKNAVTSAKIKNGSIKAKDLKPGTIPTAPAPVTPTPVAPVTPVTPAPVTPPPPAPDPYTLDTITVTTKVVVAAGDFESKRVLCPEGFQALGGGLDPFNVFFFRISSSGPIIDGDRSLFAADGQHPAATGWQATGVNEGAADREIVVSVVCAPTT